jgi:sugar phosphate isomerase/epimerase
MNRIITVVLVALLLTACKNDKKNVAQDLPMAKDPIANNKTAPKLSLAQWSLHKRYRDQGVNPLLFPEHARELGFEAVEFVSFLYEQQIRELGLETVVDSLDNALKQANVKCVLIMVDGEGDLAVPDKAKRLKAVENHKKWVDAANKFGAHSIRVNAFGSNDPTVWKEALADGLSKLAAYAATKNINVLVENHGWLSSDADLLMEVMDQIDMDNCGTLPDFGNWCVKRAEGARWGKCLEEYPDKYEGLKKMMARAKAVSAKSYDFDSQGYETTLDYGRMLDIVKAAGYDGYIGIEYEGDRLSEEEGIDATRELILKASN